MAEKQIVIAINEKRNIDRVKMPVLFGKYLAQDEQKMRWQRIREFCSPVVDISPLVEFKKQLHIVIDSRWRLPISPYKFIVPYAVLNQITDQTEVFRGAFNSTKEMSERDKRRANQGDLLGVALITIILGFVVFLLLTSNIDLKAWGW